MADSRNLRVLHAAEDYAVAVMTAARGIDVSRAPGLRGQLVRSAAADPANIAEAAHLGSDVNFQRQLRLALASASESTSHLRLLMRTGALATSEGMRCTGKAAVVCRMLVNLIKAIDEREARSQHHRPQPQLP